MRPGEKIAYGTAQTSVGSILVAKGTKGMLAIIIRERASERELAALLRARFPDATLTFDRAGMRKTVGSIKNFVERPLQNLSLPLDVQGTEFQRRVWAAVAKVPFGRTTTFTAIAEAVGSPKAARAVGNACSQNPLEFAIPCHRVLRSNGAYSGGSLWGDHRQATIVQREAAALNKKHSAKRDKGELR
jgi:AraC family transcriptional regulator of adaptative response/methylated-DNA-[protein]-cysteine methyltransferase